MKMLKIVTAAALIAAAGHSAASSADRFRLEGECQRQVDTAKTAGKLPNMMVATANYISPDNLLETLMDNANNSDLNQDMFDTWLAVFYASCAQEITVIKAYRIADRVIVHKVKQYQK